MLLRFRRQPRKTRVELRSIRQGDAKCVFEDSTHFNDVREDAPVGAPIEVMHRKLVVAKSVAAILRGPGRH